MNHNAATREAAERLRSAAKQLTQQATTQDESLKNLASLLRSAGEDLPRQAEVLRTATAKFLAFIRES